MNNFDNPHFLALIFSFMAVVTCYTGCGTTINRVATEQLLLSDAVDEAVTQIDFSHFKGQRCYLDTNYLRQNTNTGIVNSEYIVSSLRQQIVTACLRSPSRWLDRRGRNCAGEHAGSSSRHPRNRVRQK